MEVLLLLQPHGDDNDEVLSRIFLIRHGDRLDYADPSWLDRAQANGAVVTDPPLSALGHRQAHETAQHLHKSLGSATVHQILVSPYLRVVLQTASPIADAFGVPLSIEWGLAEAHATPHGVLPTAAQRFAYFPHVDAAYTSAVPCRATPAVLVCRKNGSPLRSLCRSLRAAPGAHGAPFGNPVPGSNRRVRQSRRVDGPRGGPVAVLHGHIKICPLWHV